MYGNAINNGKVNPVAFAKSGGTNDGNFVDGSGTTIDSSNFSLPINLDFQISYNADTDGLVLNDRLVIEDGMWYYEFEAPNIPSSGGNVIVSFANQGVIYWSWHLWLWPESLAPIEIVSNSNEYRIMPINLASKKGSYQSSGINLSVFFSWYYQWGRPTPLLPSEEVVESDLATMLTSSKASALVEGIRNPHIFYTNTDEPNNWFDGTVDQGLWDSTQNNSSYRGTDTVKTVYDPCPAGWKVPGINQIPSVTPVFESIFAVHIEDKNGKEWKLDKTGNRSYTDGGVYNIPDYCIWWSASKNDSSSGNSKAYNSLYYGYTSNLSDVSQRAQAYPIRPIIDLRAGGTMLILFTVESLDYIAEIGMTWFEWANSEYNNTTWKVFNNRILVSSGFLYTFVAYAGDDVKLGDTIIAGRKYEIE